MFISRYSKAATHCSCVTFLFVSNTFSYLRAFIDCERVKALVSISCCYNLLSEESCEKISASSGFPISSAAKLSSLILGKSMRDLACQVCFFILCYHMSPYKLYGLISFSAWRPYVWKVMKSIELYVISGVLCKMHYFSYYGCRSLLELPSFILIL